MKSRRRKKMAGFFCNEYFFFVFLKLKLEDFLVCSFGLKAFWAFFQAEFISPKTRLFKSISVDSGWSGCLRAVQPENSP